MNIDDIEHRLRDAIRARPVPQPQEKHMEAILSRRALGERVVLPIDTRRSKTRSIPWIIAAALAAAASIIAASRLGTPVPPGKSSAGTVASIFGPDQLFAQVTDHPTFPVIRATRPLKPGVWRYAWSDGPGAPLDTTEAWRQERSEESYESVASYRYRFGKRNREGEIVLTDTLWLNRESLRPLARVAGTLTGGHVTQIFKETSVLTGETTPGGMTSWVSREYDSLGPTIIGHGRMRAGLVEGVGPIPPWRPQIAAALESADLGPEWRGSMEALVAPSFFALRFWLNFQVVGEEKVTVPAGTFDAWKIRVGENGYWFAWVSKDRQWLLRLGPEQGERWHGQQLLMDAEMSER